MVVLIAKLKQGITMKSTKCLLRHRIPNKYVDVMTSHWYTRTI